MGSVVPSRVPLREQLIDSNRRPLLDKVIDTPVSYKHTQKISTPPETIAPAFRPKHVEPVTTPTSTKHIHPSLAGGTSKSALLSPAFSSPQRQLQVRTYAPISFEIPSKPSFSSQVPSSATSSRFSDEIDEKPAKKKAKRSKRESKVDSFDMDSNEKPPYSYATLIGMSILSHPDKRLILSQIYLWISETFRYYRREDVGWQNSIRHNLSLNKAFIKGEKSRDGKGHFWCIEEGCEDQFLKSRSSKKHSYQEIMDHIQSSIKSRPMNQLPSLPNADHASRQTLQDDSPVLEPPYKKRNIDGEENNVETIPDLGAPFTSWQPAFRLSTSATPLHRTPQVVVSESPVKPMLAGKNLTYTSSFSCNSNLEFSPIRPNETGPLLEPLTPSNNKNRSISVSLLGNPIPSLHYQPNLQQSQHTLSLPYLAKTPKSGTRTPLRTLRTPQSGSMMRRLWHSPSYLDEFYYSPLVMSSQGALNSYDDDDMILRAFELPAVTRERKTDESGRNLFNELKNIKDVRPQEKHIPDGHNRKTSSSSTESDV